MKPIFLLTIFIPVFIIGGCHSGSSDSVASSVSITAPSAADALPAPADLITQEAPVGDADLAVEEIEQGGRLGLALDDTDDGILVSEVSGPASTSGIHAGDTLLAVNGTLVSHAEAVRKLLADLPPNVAVEFLVRHHGRELLATVISGRPS